MAILSTLIRRNLREADPIQAGLQVDFEEREADPSKYTLGQNIHPASEMDDEGGNDGMAAPYDGAAVPGMPGAAPQGPPTDDQLQQIPPGGPPEQQMGQPPMQEGFMKDYIDAFLDALLDESIEEIHEGPFDNQGSPWQRAPAYSGPTPVGNPDRYAASLNRQELGMMNRYGAQNFNPNTFQPTPTPSQISPRAAGPAAPRAAGPAAQQGGDPKIRAMQQNLIKQGFNVGPTGADGVMGRNTRNAMQQAGEKGYGTSPGGGTTYTPPRGGSGSSAPGSGGNGVSGVADRDKDNKPTTASGTGILGSDLNFTPSTGFYRAGASSDPGPMDTRVSQVVPGGANGISRVVTPAQSGMPPIPNAPAIPPRPEQNGPMATANIPPPIPKAPAIPTQRGMPPIPNAPAIPGQGGGFNTARSGAGPTQIPSGGASGAPAQAAPAQQAQNVPTDSVRSQAVPESASYTMSWKDFLVLSESDNTKR